MKKFILAVAVFLLLFSSAYAAPVVSIREPDVNYLGTGTHAIVFDVKDTNATLRDLNAEIYYSSWKGGTRAYSGTQIVEDINLFSTDYCPTAADPGKFSTERECHYNWVVSSTTPADGNYYIDINFYVYVPNAATGYPMLSDSNVDSNTTYFDRQAPTTTRTSTSANENIYVCKDLSPGELTLYYRVGGVSYSSVTMADNNNTYQMITLSNGTNTYDYYCTDKAGNTEATNTYTETYPRAIGAYIPAGVAVQPITSDSIASLFTGTVAVGTSQIPVVWILLGVAALYLLTRKKPRKRRR